MNIIAFRTIGKVSRNKSCCSCEFCPNLHFGPWSFPVTNQWWLAVRTMVPWILFIEQPYIHILHLHMVLHGIALSCTISHYLALSRTILYYIALSWTILNYLALSCTILHHPVVPIRYTCSQHMSPVIAFDIAAVAQKVIVQNEGPVCIWKSGVGVY